MIILAALYIIYESVHKWLIGLSLENLGFGVVLTAAAAAINGALGAYLVWLGRRKNSIILQANGKHVLTDCWTSLAVLVGLGLVLVTNWLPFDPICGIIMAVQHPYLGHRPDQVLLRRPDGQSRPGDPEEADRHPDAREREARPDLPPSAPSQPWRRALGGSASGISRRLVIGSGSPRGDQGRTLVQESLEPRAYVTTHLECASDHDELHPDEQVEKFVPTPKDKARSRP